MRVNEKKMLLLTKAGRNLSWKLDDISNQLMNSLSMNLSYDEQAQFYKLWESLNNLLGAPFTSARPGDHPLRIQSRRFTRVLGFFARKLDSIELSFPELHILTALKGIEGININTLSTSLRVPRSTLKKLLFKLHEMGLCTKPSEKAGVSLTISEKGRACLDSVLDDLVRSMYEKIGTDKTKELEHLFSAAPLFSSAISKWNPGCVFNPTSVDNLNTRSFFLQLQVGRLREFARAIYGFAIRNDVETEVNQKIVVFDGPTPCFYAAYNREYDTVAQLDVICFREFGFSSRTNWEDVTETLNSYFINQSSSCARNPSFHIQNLSIIDNDAAPPKNTVHRQNSKVQYIYSASTEPLKGLLDLARA